MEFNKIQDVIEKKSGTFKLRGWIKRKRNMKKMLFLVLRDSTNTIQCIVEKEKIPEEMFDKIEKALIETSVVLEGKAKSDERAPNGVELIVSKIEVIAYADDFPINRDLSEGFLLDVRHLWLRSEKLSRAMKIRSEAFGLYHDFFRKEGYYEVQAPNFVSGAVEGGSTLFEVPYFGKKVYLTQSAQFYLELYTASLEKVYTIAPSYRAEKSRTRRHVTEFWHAEWETAWMDLNSLMDFEEKMIKSFCKGFLEKNKEDMKYFGRDPKQIEKVVESKFERMTYDEALEMAQKKFPELKWGQDLGEKEEREITKDFDVPIFVHHYPSDLKPFYHRPDPEKPKTLLCTDLLAPEGYGEIIGSGERTWKMDVLIERMKAENLTPEDYAWYVDLRKYGSFPHAGGGLGLARMIAWIFKLEHIRDVIGFPRTMNRYYP